MEESCVRLRLICQRDDDDHQCRVRYESSIVTANMTDPGTFFKEVPDVCAIFISRFDVFNGNRTVYHVERTVRETGKVVYNGFEEIYVNAAVDDGTDISELMKVFVEDNAYSDMFPKISEIKHRYKETEEGLKEMSDIVYEIREEGREEGRKEGKLDMLYSLVHDGMLTLEQALTKIDMSEAEFKTNMKELYGNI